MMTLKEINALHEDFNRNANEIFRYSDEIEQTLNSLAATDGEEETNESCLKVFNAFYDAVQELCDTCGRDYYDGESFRLKFILGDTLIGNGYSLVRRIARARMDSIDSSNEVVALAMTYEFYDELTRKNHEKRKKARKAGA